MKTPKEYCHKFYANENFPAPAVDALRTLGHDVLTSHDAGLSNRGTSDPAVLEFAIREKRTILTFNRWHFVALHRTHEGDPHPGMVVCSEDRKFHELAIRVHHAVREQESLSGMLIRVNRPQESRQWFSPG